MINVDYILKSGKTQKEIAQALDLKPQVLNNYIKGKSEPSIKILKALADYYHTTIDEIVGHEVPYLINKSQFTQTQLNIIEEIKNLPEEACQRIEAYILGFSAGEEHRDNIIQKFNKRGD